MVLLLEYTLKLDTVLWESAYAYLYAPSSGIWAVKLLNIDLKRWAHLKKKEAAESKVIN